jgi:hypothetical protein
MEKLNALWTPDLARAAVEAYRRENYTIQRGWWRLDSILKNGFLVESDPETLDLDISIGHRGGYGYVRGPGGREMRYGSPKFIAQDGRSQLYYFSGGIPHKIYGAALLENIVQFLARIVQMEIAERIRRDTGFRFVHQVHDELVFVVPDDMVEMAVLSIGSHLRTAPDWCAGLPLECEVTYGQRYGDCK